MIRKIFDFIRYRNLHLSVAARDGNLRAVKYLIAHGADVHDRHNMALLLACDFGHLEVVKYLVDNGADIYYPDGYPLRLTITNGHLDILKYLLSKGVVLDDKSRKMAIRSANFDMSVYISKNFRLKKGETK